MSCSNSFVSGRAWSQAERGETSRRCKGVRHLGQAARGIARDIRESTASEQKKVRSRIGRGVLGRFRSRSLLAWQENHVLNGQRASQNQPLTTAHAMWAEFQDVVFLASCSCLQDQAPQRSEKRNPQGDPQPDVHRQMNSGDACTATFRCVYLP